MNVKDQTKVPEGAAGDVIEALKSAEEPAASDPAESAAPTEFQATTTATDEAPDATASIEERPAASDSEGAKDIEVSVNDEASDSAATESPEPERRKGLALSELEIGREYEGTVRNIQPYGAFVDIGAESDGLVHISELRNGYVEKVEDVVNVNDVVTVRVKEVDPDRGRISLTMREPTKGRKKRRLREINEGQEYRGSVTSIVEFGAFVDIGATTDGLVHISELSDERVDKVEDVVSVGDDVTVRVLSVDTKRNRISLTMRERDEPDYSEYAGVEEEETTPTLIELAFARAAERAEGKDEPRDTQKRSGTTGDMSEIIRRTIEQHGSGS